MFAIYQGGGPETPDCLPLSSCALAMPPASRGWQTRLDAETSELPLKTRRISWSSHLQTCQPPDSSRHKVAVAQACQSCTQLQGHTGVGSPSLRQGRRDSVCWQTCRQ